jgi:hypothetical protein
MMLVVILVSAVVVSVSVGALQRSPTAGTRRGGDVYRGGSAMRTFLRFGVGACVWIAGIVGVLLIFAEDKRETLVVFVIWGLLCLLYRYIGKHWYDRTNTTKSLVTLVCFAIFAGVGWFVWYQREGFALLFYSILGVAAVIAFFAGGGSVADLLGYGRRVREAERDANLRVISNALDDIKKKL